jgi:hypothetical protein
MASVPAYRDLLAAEAADDPTVFEEMRDPQLAGPGTRR